MSFAAAHFCPVRSNFHTFQSQVSLQNKKLGPHALCGSCRSSGSLKWCRTFEHAICIPSQSCAAICATCGILSPPSWVGLKMFKNEGYANQRRKHRIDFPWNFRLGEITWLGEFRFGRDRRWLRSGSVGFHPLFK